MVDGLDGKMYKITNKEIVHMNNEMNEMMTVTMTQNDKQCTAGTMIFFYYFIYVFFFIYLFLLWSWLFLFFPCSSFFFFFFFSIFSESSKKDCEVYVTVSNAETCQTVTFKYDALENKKVINCQAKQERATAAGCGDVTSATFPQKPLLASTKNQANQRRRLR